MKKLITCIVMVSYLVWGLNSAAGANAETLERLRLNDLGAGALLDPQTGDEAAAGDASD